MLSSLVSLLLSIQTLLPGHKMSPFRLSNGAFPPPQQPHILHHPSISTD